MCNREVRKKLTATDGEGRTQEGTKKYQKTAETGGAVRVE